MKVLKVKIFFFHFNSETGLATRLEANLRTEAEALAETLGLGPGKLQGMVTEYDYVHPSFVEVDETQRSQSACAD